MNHFSRFMALALAAGLIAMPAVAAALGPGGDAVPTQSWAGYDPNLEYHSGLDHLAAHQYHLAKENFQHLLAVVPNQPDALYDLGQAEAGLGDLWGAAMQYQATLRADPGRIDAARDLAITDEKLRRHAQAAAVLGKLHERARACARACPEAAYLDAAIASVEAVLPPPSGG